MKALQAKLALVATERPIGFRVSRPFRGTRRISFRPMTSDKIQYATSYAVFVDLSDLPREEWRTLIEQARTLLIELAQRLSPFA